MESDVLERAQRVLKSGNAEILTYDTTGRDDSVFSLNMGCNGIVRILIEPFKADSRLFQVWESAIAQRQRETVVTVISSDFDLNVGGRLFYSQSEQFTFENVPKFFEESDEIMQSCLETFNSDLAAKTVEFTNESGKFEVFFENIDPPLNLIIFGAGFDAVPLADFAKNLGWRVCVVDHRAAFAIPERFPKVDEIVVSHPEHLSETLSFDSNSVAVLMTHNFEKDREIMKFLLGFDLKYIGGLGPKKRTERLLGEIRTDGIAISEVKLSKIYAPVGLDIGADTPEAIALSIVAEIKSVLKNRDGGFLRDRKGSIYGRN